MQKNTPKKTICLNMIVKNESKVIQRCLASVRNFIDYWVIVDTGSTDGTQQLIRKFMKNIPGELHEGPWVNFAHNRNEALSLAKEKADYSLFIDADETLLFSPSFKWPYLNKDCYRAFVNTGVFSGLRMLMVNNKLDWKWEGVLHEQIKAPSISSYEDLNSVIIVATATDGQRSKDPEKHIKDAKLLEKVLETDPENARYLFYLAQSYGNAKEYPSAIKYYERRAVMGGNEDEVFWSLYMTGAFQQELNLPSDTVLGSLWKAHYFKPDRAEPLYSIALQHFNAGNFSLAYLFSNLALPYPVPHGTGYIIYPIYDYALQLLFADAASKLKKQEETRAAYEVLLQKKGIPPKVREKILQNLRELS